MNSSLQRIIRAHTFDIDEAQKQLKGFREIVEAIRKVPKITADDSRMGQEQRQARAFITQLQSKLDKSLAKMEDLWMSITQDQAMFYSFANHSFAGRTMEENLDWLTSRLQGTEAERGADEVVRLIRDFRDKYNGY